MSSCTWYTEPSPLSSWPASTSGRPGGAVFARLRSWPRRAGSSRSPMAGASSRALERGLLPGSEPGRKSVVPVSKRCSPVRTEAAVDRPQCCRPQLGCRHSLHRRGHACQAQGLNRQLPVRTTAGGDEVDDPLYTSIKQVEAALSQIDGVRRVQPLVGHDAQWLAITGALHHPLGEAAALYGGAGGAKESSRPDDQRTGQRLEHAALAVEFGAGVRAQGSWLVRLRVRLRGRAVEHVVGRVVDQPSAHLAAGPSQVGGAIAIDGNRGSGIGFGGVNGVVGGAVEDDVVAAHRGQDGLSVRDRKPMAVERVGLRKKAPEVRTELAAGSRDQHTHPPMVSYSIQ